MLKFCQISDFLLDSFIAVHSTNMQTNTEPFQIIHTHQFCNQPIPQVVCIIVHNN